jgi:cytosine permease
MASVTKEVWPWEDKYGDYALVPVPKKETRSLLTLFYAYTGVLACIAVLWGGAALGTQFYLKDAIWVAVVGSAILAVIGGLIAPIGGVSRCSTYVNLRPSFGNVGSQVWGTIVSGVPALGWFTVQTWLFGIIVNTIFPTAPWASVFWASIWGGILMLITAYIGFKGLAFFSYLAVPFFMLIAGFGVMIGVQQGGGFAGLASIAPASPAPFGVGVTEVVGMYIVGAIITADICRYAKKLWHGAAAWAIQLMILQVYMLSGAAMITLVTGEANIAGALLAAGAGAGAFLMAILGQWSTNDNNIYSASLAINLWAPIKRKYIVLIAGAIGVALAALIARAWGSAMEPFQAFLTLLGTFLPAAGGVLIADFWVYRWYKGEPLRERYQFQPGMKIAKVNWIGWVSAIVATALGAWVIKGGITSLNCLLLGVVLYIVIAIACDKAGVTMDLGEHIIDKTGA